MSENPIPAPRYLKQTISALMADGAGFDAPDGYRLLRAELTSGGDYWRLIFERTFDTREVVGGPPGTR